MSAYVGHKLVFAERASDPEDCKRTFHDAAAALKHRTLGHERLSDIIHAANRKVAATSLLPLWVENPDALKTTAEQNIKSRRFRLSYAGMTAPNPTCAELYVPRAGFITASAWHMFAFERPLPIQLASQHVEHRFIQRCGKARQTLQYADNPFMTALGIGLFLCEIFQESNDPALLHRKPILLPHPDGFFLGHFLHAEPYEIAHSIREAAVNIHEVPLYKNSSPLLSRDRQRLEGCRNASEYTLKIATALEADVPHKLKIHIGTFIGHGDMFPDQEALHTYFRDLIDEDLSLAVRCVIESYLIGSYNKAERLFALVENDPFKRQEQTQKLESVRKKLKEITQHLSWTVSTNQMAQSMKYCTQPAVPEVA